MLNQEVTDFLREFDAGTHAILFYDSQESKRELLFSHLKFGQNYQGLAYVCSEESPQQIRGEMIQFGLEANTVKGNQRLTIANYDDVYIVNGELNISAIIGKFASLVDTCKERGLSGLRVCRRDVLFFPTGQGGGDDSLREGTAHKVFIFRKGNMRLQCYGNAKVRTHGRLHESRQGSRSNYLCHAEGILALKTSKS